MDYDVAVDLIAQDPTTVLSKSPLVEDDFAAAIEEIVRLHHKKGADYGSDEDPYENVTQSAEWGIPPWVGASIRLHDKEKRLKLFVEKGTLSNEGVEDSLIDAAVYAIIRLVLWRRERDAT